MSKFFEFIKKYDIYIILTLVLLLYFPVFFYDFVYDDVSYIINNQYINGRVSLSFFDFFIPNFIMNAIYTPFTFIISCLTLKLFGDNSFAFHFVNIFFYILSLIALYFLLKKIINNDAISFFATVLYILHPCHIECVAWISAMGYNISALFFFLSFYYFIIAFDENKKLNYFYSVIFYILAILSQPIAVPLPAILFLWVCCFRKEKLKEAIIPMFSYIPFLFIYLYLYHQTVLKTDRFVFIKYTILEKFSILGFDIFNSFIPINLCPIQPIPNIFFIIPLIIFILFCIYFRKRTKYLFFLGFIIISLLPYSNIFFSMYVPLADRYLLFTSISSSILISYLSFYVLEKFKDRILLKYISYIFFVFIYLFSFLFYLPIWKNDRILFNYAYSINPNNVTCAKSHGDFLLEDKEYDKALILSDKMIKIYPSYVEFYDIKIRALMGKNDKISAKKLSYELLKLSNNNWRYCLYLFDIYIFLYDYENASIALNRAEYLANIDDIYKNDILELFLDRKMVLSFINAESNEFFEAFKIFSNNFQLLQDNGDFVKILEKTDYTSREEICLNYLKKYNKYSKSIIRFLSCLYMQEMYKDNASKIMKSLLNDMNKAQEFINKGENDSAEKVYLNIISKNKYMYQAYYNLGILYLQTDRKEKAKEIFDKILKINPNDEKVKDILNYIK